MSAPWPQPTQPPSPPLNSRANVDPAWADIEWDYEEGRGESSSSKRRRIEDGLRKRHPSPPPPSPTLPPTPTSPDLRRRQTIADQAAVAAASQQCQVFSGNDVISCFPTAGVSIAQGQWASFVWNSRRPQLTQSNLVNIYLLRADSGDVILKFLNHDNPSDQAGSVRGMVNDTWFGQQGFSWNGKNISLPFQWAITRNDQILDSNVILQPIFTAVQTTVLSAVAAAQSSASVASAFSASSASLASLSSAAAASASAASVSATRSGGGPNATGGPNGGGNVQHATSASSFPRWAIAVIVVLGFLAIAASCILAFLILRRLRRRREAASRQGSRSSMGSASPMILSDGQPGGGRGDGGQMSQRYTDETGAPLLPPPSLAGGAIGHSPSHGHQSQYSGGNAGGVSYDGASTISDSGGPFSGADAAIMADAFRKMLRKPDFAGQIEEGESPGTDATAEGAVAGSSGNAQRTSGDAGAPPAGPSRESSDERAVHREGVLSRELAEEGRDIRSVSSSRGVRVERADGFDS